jgi:hypothetical protein
MSKRSFLGIGHVQKQEHLEDKRRAAIVCFERLWGNARLGGI